MKRLWKYVITLLSGIVVAALIAWYKDIFAQTNPQKIFHILSDAFFVVGVIVTGLGAMIFVNNEGLFDVVFYGVQNFIGMFRRNYQRKYSTFYDYKMSKGGQKVEFGSTLICGCIFVAISVTMYLLYRQFL